MSQFCPYCHCIILPNGYCRNNKCIKGNQLAATVPQIELVLKLCKELDIDVTGKNTDKLTKEKAGKLIKDLLARKAFRELYGSEVEDNE